MRKEAVAAWIGSKRRASAKRRKLRIKNNGDTIPPVENTKRRDITERMMVEGIELLINDLLLALIILKTK